MPDAPGSDQDSGKTAVLDGFLTLADEWIAQKADDRGVAWFRGAVHDVRHIANQRTLGVVIGLAPRRLGKADLSLSEAELARAEDAHKKETEAFDRFVKLAVQKQGGFWYNFSAEELEGAAA